MPRENPDVELIPSAAVRRRYGGVSAMWLHRRERDESGFPAPIRISGRRFWRIRELERWEQEQDGNEAR